MTPYAKPAIALSDEDVDGDDDSGLAPEEIAPVVVQPLPSSTEATLP